MQVASSSECDCSSVLVTGISVTRQDFRVIELRFSPVYSSFVAWDLIACADDVVVANRCLLLSCRISVKTTLAVPSCGNRFRVAMWSPSSHVGRIISKIHDVPRSSFRSFSSPALPFRSPPVPSSAHSL